jgi:hypothetical protein
LTKGAFSSPFHPKKIGFWFIILQNRTKYYAKILAKKASIFHFGFWPQEAKKKSQKVKKPSPTP